MRLSLKRHGTLAGIGSLVIHAVVVYACALYLSPWLVGRWFAWGVPIMHISPRVTPGDWYLEHLELISIMPALVMGCIAVRVRNPAGAIWVWIVPAFVLAYMMLQFHAPSSVLYGSSMSAFRYYFDIKQVMPTITNFLTSDPVRVAAQRTVTAPFYAGAAYSLGAWVSKRSFFARLFGPDSADGPHLPGTLTH